MSQLPDAPWIREAEMYGYPPYDVPDVHCPICGKECDTIFRDKFGDVFGCEYCVDRLDSGEWYEEKKESERDI